MIFHCIFFYVLLVLATAAAWAEPGEALIRLDSGELWVAIPHGVRHGMMRRIQSGFAQAGIEIPWLTPHAADPYIREKSGKSGN